MATLAIKGHSERGNEVIERLEMLGGNNKYHINITECNLLYTIRKGDDAIIATYPNSNISKIYTLEEFDEKFPYKVGDKVYYDVCGIQKITTIVKMEYNEDFNDIDCTMENGDIISHYWSLCNHIKKKLWKQ